MVGAEIMSIKTNEVIEKTIRRLNNLGLKGQAEVVNDNHLMLVITGESIINTVKRLVSKNITYPKSYIEYNKELNVLVVHFWKGEMPQSLKQKMLERMIEKK
ncbi:MAG: hypothetical protein CBR30_09700 [Dictyoglomus sp. NZ13-RE01]|nr:MAG: hypothetical protein CBR30_09700 [Dictyoglomus sp. NZ13-RE01]